MAVFLCASVVSYVFVIVYSSSSFDASEKAVVRDHGISWLLSFIFWIGK